MFSEKSKRWKIFPKNYFVFQYAEGWYFINIIARIINKLNLLKFNLHESYMPIPIKHIPRILLGRFGTCPYVHVFYKIQLANTHFGLVWNLPLHDQSLPNGQVWNLPLRGWIYSGRFGTCPYILNIPFNRIQLTQVFLNSTRI